jgi:hypothetical protein
MALAASPQALQDARRLVNATRERAEEHYWSVFLSYQTPSAENRGATPYVADNRTKDDGDCPLERVAAGAEQKAIPLSRGGKSGPVRALQAAGRTSEKARSIESVASNAVGEEKLAGLEKVEARSTAAQDRSALRAAGLHTGEIEREAAAASKASMAFSFSQIDEKTLKLRQIREMEKPLRQRTRYLMDITEPGSPPESANPNPVGSM